MWLHASQYHGWTDAFVSPVIEKIAFEFINERRKEIIFPDLVTSCRKMANNGEKSPKRNVLLFLSRKANTPHCCAHSIMPVTQRLSSRPWSIRSRQLWGHIETPLSLTTSQSIVADYWLEKLAGVCDAALLLQSCTHTQTPLNTRCTNATSCCSQTLFPNHQHTHKTHCIMYTV